ICFEEIAVLDTATFLPPPPPPPAPSLASLPPELVQRVFAWIDPRVCVCGLVNGLRLCRAVAAALRHRHFALAVLARFVPSRGPGKHPTSIDGVSPFARFPWAAFWFRAPEPLVSAYADLVLAPCLASIDAYSDPHFHPVARRPSHMDRPVFGRIPDAIGRLHLLVHLGLAHNSLHGSIPETIGNLHNLKHLYLNDNFLTGSIPSTLCHLKFLKFCDLSHNQLSGTIPSDIGCLQSMQALDLSHNILHGPIPSGLGDLHSFQNLALDNADAIATALDAISTKHQLKTIGASLNLSFNNLAGEIPEALGNLVCISSLELNHNQLSGLIPASLGRLTAMWKLRLDNNRLEGEVPAAIVTLRRLKVREWGNNRELKETID
ncbi:hypothetical protein HDU83_009602, partial [Entophlyctis luteolus]